MQSEYIEIVEISPETDFDLPTGSLFIDAGTMPCGRCWVSPSKDFFELWLLDDRLSDYLGSLGFEFAFDGDAVGSRSEFIFYCPPNMGALL